MNYKPLVFSLLFFMTFAIYLFFGIYTIFKSPRKKLNRLFFIINISLATWAFGFAMANPASTMENALLWRRVSALGWTSIYSFLLHFLLILTKDDKTPNPGYYLLHIPGLINMLVFGIYGKMAIHQYRLLRSDYGWINVAVNNGWDIFFYIYYISYSLACLGLIWRERKRTSGKDYRQNTIIFNSILLALILGSLTDIILNSILKGALPQMAPIFTLIPIGAIYYSMRHYSLMDKKLDIGEEPILTHETLEKIYYYLALAFLSGGLLTFLSYFLSSMIKGRENLQATLISSIILFGFGCIILGLQLIKRKKIRNFLAMTATLLSIPIITLRFVQYASITVWAFPMILIIIALVFNARLPLILVTLVSILTQIIVWVHAPEDPIPMDRFDYIIRMGMFLIAFWIGMIVNNIYIKRLKENTYQRDFQKIISEISFDFANVCQNTIDEKINNMLIKTGEFFKVDRTYVFLFNHDSKTMTYAHEWRDREVKGKMQVGSTLPLAVYPWWIEELTSKRLINIKDINSLPGEAKMEKEAQRRQENKSVLVIPIGEGQKMLGFIGLDSVKSFKTWTNYHVEMLKILSNLLADGLIKIKAEKEIEIMAYYDYLTGLPKRKYFLDKLAKNVEFTKSTKRKFGLMFMNLDSFQAINDIAGHSTGDLILEKVANNLKKNLRPGDLLARFDGDEFLLMINNVENDREIERVVSGTMGIFQKPTRLLGREYFISSSAGVAIFPKDGGDTESLVKNAEMALQVAKLRGKSQYAFCTEQMKMEMEEEITLSKHLYWALERDELDLYYQPQISLNTGEIIGLEALLRWKHPQMGMISPGVFIPLAEQNGLINSIGDWVLKTASRQGRVWQDKGLPPLRIAVNLSILQFNNPNMVRNLKNILNETGLNPQSLELEITENIAIEEERYTRDVLHKLKKLGVSISIDDFGTAYSSLGRLKTLPIDRIKIDMQFVQAIENSEKDQAIVQVIINLAKSLGLGVLAEGVETKDQLEFLHQKKCDDVQGYYYYRPMPVDEIEALLQYNGRGRR